MAWYLANRDEVLDQFATGGGLTELRAASDGYPALKTFLDEGVTKNIAMCKLQLEKLASRTDSDDVKDTASGLAKLMDGQEFVAITQGFGFAPEHDTEKEDASTATTESLREAAAPSVQQRRDKLIAGASRKIQKLMRDRFRAQRKSVLDSHALRTLKPPIREADDPERARLEAYIAAALSTYILDQPVTADEQATFASAITKAIGAGSEAAATMTSTAAGAATMTSTAAGDTESFIAEYLKDGGFSRLTGDLDKTTVDRLASAVADAYESGADFDGVVRAVKGSFADATTMRAKMIAQTELNDAYNQSILHFGREAGAEEKWWETDLAPCPICIENALEGRIPIDSDFPSGDDAPPSHPNCLCSLGVGIAL